MERVEVIFVEGGSSDGTWETLERECALYDGHYEVSYHRQPGTGKWDAVKYGFGLARGDVLIIHDGDLTVDPADLSRFYEPIAEGWADFVNGSRLVMQMESGAMPLRNVAANMLFAFLVSVITGNPTTDSLCGTKALKARDWHWMKRAMESVERLDPFGDFTLLFGAKALGLRVHEAPVLYWKRRYGKSNILHWKGGLQLLRLCWVGWRRLR